MAVVLPLLLVSGTCPECRVASFLWPGALNQFCTRHQRAAAHTLSPTVSPSLCFSPTADGDAPFAHGDPRVRLKRTVLTLNWTKIQREKNRFGNGAEQRGSSQWGALK